MGRSLAPYTRRAGSLFQLGFELPNPHPCRTEVECTDGKNRHVTTSSLPSNPCATLNVSCGGQICGWVAIFIVMRQRLWRSAGSRRTPGVAGVGVAPSGHTLSCALALQLSSSIRHGGNVYIGWRKCRLRRSLSKGHIPSSVRELKMCSET
jgi:hypothetical protein